MQITNALNITAILNDAARKVPAVRVAMQILSSLPIIELQYLKEGLEEGSFGVVRLVYSDGTVEHYFDYPTDMSEEEARDISIKIADKLFATCN